MNGGILRFGRVEFDRARERLRIAGEPVALDRFSLAVLRLLFDEAGHEVSKDALLEAGWSGRVVQENSLAKAVGRLRGALGEDGAAIETVHGYGYRLAADVTEQAPLAHTPWNRPRRTAAVISSLVLLALAGTTAFALREREKPVVNGEAPNSVGRVLWVDDHPQNNAAERRFFASHKVAIYQVGSTAEALTLLSMYEYGAVISDMGRNEKPLAGLNLLREMRARGDERPFYLYTVHASTELDDLIAEAGGQGVAESREELYAGILPLFGLPVPTLRPGEQGAEDAL